LPHFILKIPKEIIYIKKIYDKKKRTEGQAKSATMWWLRGMAIE
jgi:hypothetical protein